MLSLPTRCSLLAAFLAFGSLAAGQTPPPCAPEWIPTFGSLPPHLEAMAVADLGNGPTLYGGGAVQDGSLFGPYFMGKWNGRAWLRIEGNFDGRIAVITSWDDGSGMALYVAGSFTSIDGMPANGIVRWTGSDWAPLGSGLDGRVNAIAVYDDGSGPALHVGGVFTTAGSVPASCMAKWDGTTWSALGAGTGGTWPDSPEVMSLAVFDDGSGSALYAGGSFPMAGGQPAPRIARWDGSQWSPVGSAPGVGFIWTLTVFDDGSGPALYAGGPSGSYEVRVVKWDGSNWSFVGGPFFYQYPFAPLIRTLIAYDDGGGEQLYVGGQFTGPGGGGPYHMLRWNGASWVGNGNAPPVGCAVVHDDGTGSKLWVSGKHQGAGITNPGGGELCWDGTAWTSPTTAPWSAVTKLASADLGAGNELYVGGMFTRVGDIASNLVARWDGSHWSGLDTGLRDPSGGVTFVSALKLFDNGSGPMLYVSGMFQTAGPVTSPRLARWNGTQWLPSPAAVPAFVPNAMQSFDDGTGAALYIAGTTPTQGRVCKLTGSTWTTVGTAPSSSAYFGALEVFDDGSGPALYAAGSFVSISGVPASSCIAKWNGTQWTSIGNIVPSPALNGVSAMAVWDDGSGPALFVGGSFSSAGGVPVHGLAKWDGQAWSDVGGGVVHVSGVGGVGALTVFDDGSGSCLIVGGYFDHAGSIIADGLARWDGSNWSTLGNERRPAAALAVHDDGSGPALFIGGVWGPSFDGERWIAKWGNPAGCGAPGVSVCEPGVGGVGACPCSNPPTGLGRGCDNSSSSGGAALSASGIARLTFDSLVFTSSGEPPSATSTLVQGDVLSATGIVYGQGVRCVGGALKRMYLKTAVAGSIAAPSPNDPHVSVRSAALGDPLAPGTHRYYAVVYRDPIVLGGCPAASGFNITQQLDVLWSP